MICLCIFGFAAMGKSTDPPSGAEQIYLQGKLDTNAGPNDIEAYFYGNAVYIDFHRDFGNVTIMLYNPVGSLVYNDVVNTAVQQLVVIPVSCTSDGIYTIFLETATGSASGDFEMTN